MKKEDIKILIIVLIIVSIVIYFLVPKSGKFLECQIDLDCVPSSCCHPDSCVSKEQKPTCEGILCSMSCEGPLDCGVGTCACNKNKCEVANE